VPLEGSWLRAALPEELPEALAQRVLVAHFACPHDERRPPRGGECGEVLRALYRRAYAFLDTETGEVTVSPAGHRAASNVLAGEGFTKRTRGGVAYVWSPPKPTLEELQAADAKCAELQAWLRDYLARAGQDVPR